MNIEFTTHGWEEFTYWLENDVDTALKVKELIKAMALVYNCVDISF
ncbi:type II toxin-antitoxin system YoeB family toxin [Aquimarina sp. I32.4]|nr:type II toxin-antitoxin system YoeB family toxin [Aquimarina sp. I32.4]